MADRAASRLWNGLIERYHYLGRVLNNAKFLLLPWIRAKNLASKILALSARQEVADDFAACYINVLLVNDLVTTTI